MKDFPALTDMATEVACFLDEYTTHGYCIAFILAKHKLRELTEQLDMAGGRRSTPREVIEKNVHSTAEKAWLDSTGLGEFRRKGNRKEKA